MNIPMAYYSSLLNCLLWLRCMRGPGHSVRSLCPFVQAMQQELEKLTKDRPTLTPRPTREVAPLKDLINNEKVGRRPPSQGLKNVILLSVLESKNRQSCP